MQAVKVLDTYALIAFFADEPGADFVRGLLVQALAGDLHLAMCVVNLGEVWYTVARAVSPQRADATVEDVRALAIEIVEADWPLTYQAAVYKARGALSYADCYTAALAKLRGAEVVTADPEFQKLAREITTLWEN